MRNVRGATRFAGESELTSPGVGGRELDDAATDGGRAVLAVDSPFVPTTDSPTSFSGTAVEILSVPGFVLLPQAFESSSLSAPSDWLLVSGGAFSTVDEDLGALLCAGDLSLTFEAALLDSLFAVSLVSFCVGADSDPDRATFSFDEDALVGSCDVVEDG